MTARAEAAEAALETCKAARTSEREALEALREEQLRAAADRKLADHAAEITKTELEAARRAEAAQRETADRLQAEIERVVAAEREAARKARLEGGELAANLEVRRRPLWTSARFTYDLGEIYL